MKRFEFKPNLNKSGRNRYVGSWEESRCKHIDLPLTKESLKTVVLWGVNPEVSPYTHQEIAHWCCRLFLEAMEVDLPIDEVAIDVAQDVDAQWDLYLVNTYKLEELQKLNFSEVNLPTEWFVSWLDQLNA